MFAYSGITAVVFRFINSALLFAAGWYLYKKYAQTSIEEKLDEQQGYIAGLSQQKKALHSKKIQLKHELAAQEQLCVALKQKVLDWQEHVSEKLDKRAQEKKKIVKKAQEIINQQNNYLMQKKVITRSTRASIENNQKKIARYFWPTK